MMKTTIANALGEQTGGYTRLTPTENRRLEQIVKLEIRSRMAAVIRKLQQLNSDPIDFGEQLRVQHLEV